MKKPETEIIPSSERKTSFNIELSSREIQFQDQWIKMYELLKIYYQHHHHSNVSTGFKTINGYEYDETGANLGNWVATQRMKYKSGKLSEDRLKKLSILEFNYNLRKNQFQDQWTKMYELLKIYYQYHGNSHVPSNFITINGYEHDELGVNLGNWVATQRMKYKTGKLSEDRLDKLSQVEFNYNLRKKQFQDQWTKMYELLKIYYQHYGHSNAPTEFITINGYEYDENGVNLGNWITTQRMKYKSGKLSEDHLEKLSQIAFNCHYQKSWTEMYELLKKYYQYYANTNVPRDFKTINGYEYNRLGVSLGTWVDTQRTAYKTGKLTEERLNKLESLGMRLITKKEHTNKIVELCLQYGLNYKNNKILNKISYQELYAKIEFLTANNIPLAINGYLNPFFGMSSKNMEVIYNISKEELISKYYHSIQEKGNNHVLKRVFK